MLSNSTIATKYNLHFCFHTHICDAVKGLYMMIVKAMHNALTDKKILYPL